MIINKHIVNKDNNVLKMMNNNLMKISLANSKICGEDDKLQILIINKILNK